MLQGAQAKGSCNVWGHISVHIFALEGLGSQNGSPDYLLKMVCLANVLQSVLHGKNVPGHGTQKGCQEGPPRTQLSTSSGQKQRLMRLEFLTTHYEINFVCPLTPPSPLSIPPVSAGHGNAALNTSGDIVARSVTKLKSHHADANLNENAN